MGCKPIGFQLPSSCYMTPLLQHMALSLYSTLRDTCMGKNYLASCPEHHTLYGVTPPPLNSITISKSNDCKIGRCNYQTRKQGEEKGHLARLITKEPVSRIMLASFYRNCCDLQCNDVFKGLKYVICKTPNFHWRCSVLFS